MISHKNKGMLLGSCFILFACQPTPLASQPQGIESNLLVSYSLSGRVEFPQSLQIQAAASAIPSFATLALLYPPGHAESGHLLSSARSDASGHFVLEIDPVQPPAIGSLFILEATRRFSDIGQESLSLRTFVRWNGTGWESISQPGVILNAKTTTLALIADLDPVIQPENTLNAIAIEASGSEIQAGLGSYSVDRLNQISQQISALLNLDRDPAAYLAIQNGSLYVRKPEDPQLKWILESDTCKSCDLTGAKLTNLDLSQRDFSLRLLNQAYFTNSNLSQANFSQAQINQGTFKACQLSQTDLSTASLQSAHFRDVQFSQTNLTQANLNQADLSGVDLQTALLGNADLSQAILRGANLDQQDLRTVNLSEATAAFASLQGANLSGVNLNAVDFQGAQLKFANLQNSQLDQAKLDTADLSGALLNGANLGTASLKGAKLDQATWVNGKTCETGSRSLCKYEWVVNQTTAGSQQSSSVATAPDGRSVIVWNDSISPFILAQRYDSQGLPAGPVINVSQSSASASALPDVAMANDGHFVVSWDQASDGDGTGILARIFAADGTASGDAFIVNAGITGAQQAPAIAIAPISGQFVVVWTDAAARDGWGQGVYQRRFLADGTPMEADDTSVNFSNINGNQGQADIAMNETYFTVAYTDQKALDGSLNGVFARTYRLTNNQASSLLQINTTTNNNQEFPAIAMRDSGTFTVAWQSRYQDGNGYGIFMRRFSINNGTASAISSEARVNTHTTFDQLYPAIGMDARGYFVIAWQSQSQDGSFFSVYGQRFDFYGDKKGAEFKINTYSDSRQQEVSIALASSRRITASWSSDGVDGQGYGIAAKQMEY